MYTWREILLKFVAIFSNEYIFLYAEQRRSFPSRDTRQTNTIKSGWIGGVQYLVHAQKNIDNNSYNWLTTRAVFVNIILYYNSFDS